MKFLTFVIFALTTRAYIVLSECWLPIVCNGIPYWTKMETECHQNSSVAEMKILMKNDLVKLTDQTTDIANELQDLENKFKELKLRKAANNSLKTTSEVETTANSIDTSVLISKTTVVHETLEQATQTTDRSMETTGGIEKLERKENFTAHALLADGWQEAGNGLFYKTFLTKVNYATAKKRCGEEGAILAAESVRNPLVFRILQTWTRDNNQVIWIGLDDIVQEGRWIWLDGIVADSRTPWKSGEPNNAYNEDCAIIHWDNLREIFDYQCSTQLAYICEKNI